MPAAPTVLLPICVRDSQRGLVQVGNSSLLEIHVSFGGGVRPGFQGFGRGIQRGTFRL